MPLAISAGIWKGRPLIAPPKGPVRPTSALLRGALFDKLGARVISSGLLDLFSGSGAISLEALSRGAARAVAVESNRSSLKVLCENRLRFSCQDALTVVQGDVFAFLRRPWSKSPFDWIFADPPYDLLKPKGVFEELMALAAAHLQARGLFILERSRRIDLNQYLEHWRHCSTRTYGDSCLDLFERI